jgi:hypothetical protein
LRYLTILIVIVAVSMGSTAYASDISMIGDSILCSTYVVAPSNCNAGIHYVDDVRTIHAVNGLKLAGSRNYINQVVSDPTTHILVVALGSNDVAQKSLTMRPDIFRAANQPVGCVVITTVKVRGVTSLYNRRWITYARRWNGIVRESGAVVADWNAFSQGKPNWFLSDGLHLTRIGRIAYHSMLTNAINRCALTN